MGDPVIVGTTWYSSHQVADMKATIEALQARLAAVEAERDAARDKALEEAAAVAERFAECALKCKRCGDVRHQYWPGGCSGEAAFKASDEGQKMFALDGAFEAMRYFEKHLCRPDPMDHQQAFAEAASAIRTLKEQPHG